MRNRIFYLIFPFFALMSPIVGNIHVVHDTILSEGSSIQSAGSLWAPVLILSALSLLAGILIAGLDILENPARKKVSAFKLLLCAGVVFVSLDLSYGGKEIAQSLWPFGFGIFSFWHEHRLWLLICAVVALLSIYIVCRALQKNLGVILVSVFGTVFVTTLIMSFYNSTENKKPVNRVVKGRSDLPPMIHIILDEMIGAEGIDRSLPGGEATYRLVRRFNDRFKFRLYGKTFSRHMATMMAIPNLLNYDFTDNTPGDHSKYLLHGDWKYLEDMQKRGYTIHIYQTTHIDFCSSNTASTCNVLNPFNPASVYISAPKQYNSGSTPVTPIIIGLLLQSPSRSYSSYTASKFIALAAKNWYFAPRYDVQSFNLWFDKFSNEAIEARNGDMFFAHFLAPHEPYILDRNCDTRPVYENRYFLKDHRKLSGEDLQKARKAYYLDYYPQVACVFKKLTGFMEKIERLDHFKNATILIHGDHGSRISSGGFFENHTEQDFVDNYSTYFSVRSPDIKPGYDLRSVSIQRLFSEMFQKGQKINYEDKTDTVVINSIEKGRVINAKMPVFGARFPATASQIP